MKFEHSSRKGYDIIILLVELAVVCILLVGRPKVCLSSWYILMLAGMIHIQAVLECVASIASYQSAIVPNFSNRSIKDGVKSHWRTSCTCAFLSFTGPYLNDHVLRSIEAIPEGPWSMCSSQKLSLSMDLVLWIPHMSIFMILYNLIIVIPPHQGAADHLLRKTFFLLQLLPIRSFSFLT